MNEIKANTKDISQIKPQGNQVLIEYELPEEKTASGIIIPKDVTDKNQKNYVGHIVSMGSDVKGEFKVGSRVVFAKGRQYDFHLKPDSETAGFPSHCFVTYYDIIAVVEGEGKVFAN